MDSEEKFGLHLSDQVRHATSLPRHDASLTHTLHLSDDQVARLAEEVQMMRKPAPFSSKHARSALTETKRPNARLALCGVAACGGDPAAPSIAAPFVRATVDGRRPLSLICGLCRASGAGELTAARPNAPPPSAGEQRSEYFGRMKELEARVEEKSAAYTSERRAREELEASVMRMLEEVCSRTQSELLEERRACCLALLAHHGGAQNIRKRSR